MLIFVQFLCSAMFLSLLMHLADMHKEENSTRERLTIWVTIVVHLLGKSKHFCLNVLHVFT